MLTDCDKLLLNVISHSATSHSLLTSSTLFQVILCFRKVLPAHIMAVHFIVKSPIAHLAIPYILHALGPFLRTRSKLHEGSDYDIASALSKYGISQEELPFGQAPPLVTAPP
jgi:hypothetical protein